MKALVPRILMFLVFTGALIAGYSQVEINDGGTADPDGSAVLDLESTTKGFLVPRLTADQKDDIEQPATGLLIFQTNGAAGFYYNGGTPDIPEWTLLTSSSNAVLWIRNASDKSTFLANPDDSVGIGRQSPTEKLDIKGNLDIDNFQPLILFREDSLKAGQIMHFGSPDAGYLHLQAWDGNNFETTGLVVKAPGQNVGVGTTSPAFKLDVAGTTRTAGFILSSSTGNGYILTSDENGVASWQVPASHLAGSGDPGYLAKFSDDDTLKNSIAFQDSNGKLGIGTASPAEQLDVNGKLNMRDNIRMNGNWLSDDGSNEGLFVSSAGNVGVGTSSPASKFTSSGMIQTMTGGVKFPDNTVQTTAAAMSANQVDAADPRWIIGMEILGVDGPYDFEYCNNCCKVFSLEWYINNTFDSVTGMLINNFPQHHMFSIIKDIDETTVDLIEKLFTKELLSVHLNFYQESTEPGPEFTRYYVIHLQNVSIVKLEHVVSYLGGDRFAHMDKINFIYQEINFEFLEPLEDFTLEWMGR